MKMKRVLSILLAIMLMASVLSGCGTTENPPEDLGQNQIETPETPGDGQQDQEGEEVVALDKDTVILENITNYLNTIPENSYMIKADEGLELAEDNAGQLLFVDIRAKEDYDEGHLPGAVNIPYGEIGKNLNRFPKNKQIIINCYSGQTSGIAAAALQLLDFNALSYQGGMNFGWKPLELDAATLETTENPLPDEQAVDNTEEEQILWDLVVEFFNEGKNYIEQAADVHELNVDNPDAIFILDIRAGEDYEKGHIEGSVNIPFKQVGQNLDQIPKNRPIYITCYSGQTAAQILTMLRFGGYNAYSISRGMAGWNGAELPVVTE